MALPEFTGRYEYSDTPSLAIEPQLDGEPVIDLGHLALVYRPGGTNEATARGIVERLSDNDRQIDLVESQPDIDGNREQLQELQYQNPLTAVGIIGGDGTKSNVLAGMLTGGIEATAWIGPGGNFDDLRRMLYGNLEPDQPERLLRAGRVARLHPIAVTIQPPDDATPPHTEYAFGYWSFGASGQIAAAANSPNHRARQPADRSRTGRFLADARMAMRTIRHSRQFDLWGLDYAKLIDSQRVSDVVLANGRLMAGSLRFKDNDLLRPGFAVATQQRPNARSLAAAMLRSLSGNFKRVPLEQEWSRFVEFDQSEEQAWFAQRDGEHWPIESKSFIRARAIGKSIAIHTTRPVTRQPRRNTVQ